MRHSIIHPKTVLPLDPAEFKSALQVGFKSAIGQNPAIKPTAFGFTFEEESGRIRNAYMKNCFTNRFGYAVRHFFRDDRNKFFNFMLRWYALDLLIRYNRLPKKYSRPEDFWIDDSVAEIAATFPIGKKGMFNLRNFILALEALP
jgi:hypothetical protein